MERFKVRFSSHKRAEADAFLEKMKAQKDVNWAYHYYGYGGCHFIKVEGDFSEERKKELLGNYTEYTK